MADDTASDMRDVERERYSDSNVDTERRASTASGLTSASQRFRPAVSPLGLARVDGVGVHGDLGEEVVEQAQQAGIPGAEGLLEPPVRCCQLDEVGQLHIPLAASLHCDSKAVASVVQNVKLGFSSSFWCELRP